MFRKSPVWDYERFPVGSDEHWNHEERMVWSHRRRSRLRRIACMISRNKFRNKRWCLVLTIAWWNTYLETY